MKQKTPSRSEMVRSDLAQKRVALPVIFIRCIDLEFVFYVVSVSQRPWQSAQGPRFTWKGDVTCGLSLFAVIRDSTPAGHALGLCSTREMRRTTRSSMITGRQK